MPHANLLMPSIKAWVKQCKFMEINYLSVLASQVGDAGPRRLGCPPTVDPCEWQEDSPLALEIVLISFINISIEEQTVQGTLGILVLGVGGHDCFFFESLEGSWLKKFLPIKQHFGIVINIHIQFHYYPQRNS